ncbi:MAG: hypothetical protein IPG78_07365 [Ignavibacteria bacterium]|nr:hypothetical protein [Ignavibacteria bacterium]
MRLKRKVKFITLYNTFSETERNHFKLFISSPLFNGGRDYSDIIEDIESHKFKYSELTVTKANRTLWNRLSELTKLAERFLVIKSAEYEKYIFDLFLLKEFRKRNLDEYFKKEIEKQLLDIKITLPATLESNIFFEINDLYLEYLKSKADDKKFEAQFREDANYKIAFFALDLLDRLIQLWERKLSKSISSDLYIESFFQTLDLKNLLVHIKKNVPNMYPVIAFWYNLYNALGDPLNNSHYKNAIKIFYKELDFLPGEYKEKLYSYLIEYNIELHNRLVPGADKELFSLIKNKLREGLYADLLDSNFTTNHFRDYFFTALSLNEIVWIEKFIDEFGPKLPEEFRNDNILLVKVTLMLQKKQFSEAKEQFKKMKRINPFAYIDISHLKLIVYYELGEIDECYKELRRLLEYLGTERKVQQDLIKYTRIFCDSYNLLLKLKENPTKKNLNNLQFELSKENITGRRWIKLKMEEIKNHL